MSKGEKVSKVAKKTLKKQKFRPKKIGKKLLGGKYQKKNCDKKN